MVSSQGGEDRKQLPLPVIILVVVVAVALAGFMAYKSFSGPPVAPASATEQTNNKTIEDIVKRSNGDFSKVTPEDMATLQKVAGNFAAVAYNDVKKKMSK